MALNPIVLLGGLAALALAMGGKKAKAASSSENPVNVNLPPVKLVPKQEEGDTDAEDAPQVNIGPAVITSPTSSASTNRPMTVTNAETGVRVTKDEATARKSAQSVADHVRSKQYNYSRPLLAVWQAHAGIASDGIYGPETVAKLRGYGAKNVNKALFPGAKK
jgi:hypothetical protein